ncbi:MAG: division/cell wall cluster transcriptional repressor MraZ [Treponema sp.]|jgi:MraZ protein|nr:division/cell wall cluster transcriptional repressor MraZ [Treponema sp.]
MEPGVGGTFPSTLDDKGRVGIPIKLRDKYSGELVITLGLRTCAWIMRNEVWNRIHGQLAGSGALTEDDQELVELQFVAPLMETELDKAGRIAIPPIVRRYAGLKKDCMILNLENRLEVWDEELLLAHLLENRTATKEAIRKMGSLRLFKLDT